MAQKSLKLKEAEKTIKIKPKSKELIQDKQPLSQTILSSLHVDAADKRNGRQGSKLLSAII